MLYEFHLDESHGTKITAKERNLLIRHCLSVGTRATCSTAALCRPFRQKYLKKAFDELREAYRVRIAEYERRAETYDPESAKISENMLAFFGGVPSKEEYTRYCRELILQERKACKSMQGLYSVNVNYAFIGRKLLAFHNSLNPRVTFGCSNQLHEECDFALDEENKRAFLGESSLKFPPKVQGSPFDWGTVTFEISRLIYRDLTVFRGEGRILETISHEEMMTVFLTKEDLAALEREKGGKRLVKKLREIEK